MRMADSGSGPAWSNGNSAQMGSDRGRGEGADARTVPALAAGAGRCPSNPAGTWQRARTMRPGVTPISKPLSGCHEAAENGEGLPAQGASFASRRARSRWA